MHFLGYKLTLAIFVIVPVRVKSIPTTHASFGPGIVIFNTAPVILFASTWSPILTIVLFVGFPWAIPLFSSTRIPYNKSGGLLLTAHPFPTTKSSSLSILIYATSFIHVKCKELKMPGVGMSCTRILPHAFPLPHLGLAIPLQSTSASPPAP
jgi:hypothetical protein